MRIIWNNCRIQHSDITARINRVASATAVMSSAEVDNPRSRQKVSTENDVAGAALNGRSRSQLTVPQLKRWLLCRGTSVKGRKGDLVAK